MKAVTIGNACLIAGLACSLVGCKTTGTPPPLPEPAPIPPAQYGEPGQDPAAGIPSPPEQGGGGGRFGYTGANPPAADGSTPGMRDVRDIGATTPAPAPQPAPAPAPPPAPTTPSPSEMPYANPVAGNPLVVTMPGVSGPISIEKYDSAGKPTGEPLKRGTQVQIPDPNNPGKKIYFKVP
jgi:hypothetical protein